MPKVKPDFSEHTPYTPPPSGHYPVQIERYEIKDNFEKGELVGKKIFWKLKIVKSPENKYNGKIIHHTTALSGRFSWKLKSFMSAVDPGYSGHEFDPDELLGRYLEVFVQYDQGGSFPEVRDCKPYFPEGSLADPFL